MFLRILELRKGSLPRDSPRTPRVWLADGENVSDELVQKREGDPDPRCWKLNIYSKPHDES
jgi:hypothetical protein